MFGGDLILCSTVGELGKDNIREKGSYVSYKTNCNLIDIY